MEPYLSLVMLNNKYYRFVYSFFMSLMMSCFMSFVITLFNLGWNESFFQIWCHSWAFAFIVAYPTVLCFGPIVKRITECLVKSSF